ncbi:type III PLP-dependent enzyme [Magnetovibrio sp.]|uniref:type III PLP-dependent enzyme n=1 Tax=Magnetovibrio sp. TaxID=2024836 RepID=UPI002F951429
MFATDLGSNARFRRQISQKPQISLVPDLAEGIQLPDEQGGLSPRIAKFIATHELPSPCLVIDVDIVEHNYMQMTHALPLAHVYYAVKANPAAEVVARLAELGSNFDTASPGEIDLCLNLGVAPSRISYGNTIKKQADIAYAYTQGIRMFAFDSEAELEKISISAPGSKVYCRILVESEGAEWPLSRKFGCEPDMALDLLLKAQDLGLDPIGVSFHVGSQQTNLNQWDPAIAQVAKLFERASAQGVDLRMIDMGGGFPSRYRADVQPVEDYADKIMSAMVRHFGAALPEMILEPGRSLVGDAGVIQAEVVLTSKKSASEDKRWVYLDIGKFSGLAETMDEAIKYRILTPHDGGETGPVVLAGPTCDSADILYEKTAYEMPLALEAGDKVLILSTGAYTTTYSAVNFNGFAPLEAVCI